MVEKLSNTLIGVALDICLDMESGNGGTVHYDLHIEDFPDLEDSDCLRNTLQYQISRDKRVLQCEIGCIDYHDVSIDFTDEALIEGMKERKWSKEEIENYIKEINYEG